MQWRLSAGNNNVTLVFSVIALFNKQIHLACSFAYTVSSLVLFMFLITSEMVSHAQCLQCSIYPVPCCIANVKLHEQFHSIEITNKALSFNLTHQLISMFETLEGSIQIVSWKMHRFAGITCGFLCFLVASCTGKNIKNNNIAELFVYYSCL